MDSQGEFAQDNHGLMGVFAEETTVILRKSNIQYPVHRLNFPVLLGKLHQLFGESIPAGNVIAGLPAVPSANLHDPFNGKNRLQPSITRFK